MAEVNTSYHPPDDAYGNNNNNMMPNQEDDVGFYEDSEGLMYFLDRHGREYYPTHDFPDHFGFFEDGNGAAYFVDEDGKEHYPPANTYAVQEQQLPNNEEEDPASALHAGSGRGYEKEEKVDDGYSPDRSRGKEGDRRSSHDRYSPDRSRGKQDDRRSSRHDSHSKSSRDRSRGRDDRNRERSRSRGRADRSERSRREEREKTRSKSKERMNERSRSKERRRDRDRSQERSSTDDDYDARRSSAGAPYDRPRNSRQDWGVMSKLTASEKGITASTKDQPPELSFLDFAVAADQEAAKRSSAVETSTKAASSTGMLGLAKGGASLLTNMAKTAVHTTADGVKMVGQTATGVVMETGKAAADVTLKVGHVGLATASTATGVVLDTGKKVGHVGLATASTATGVILDTGKAAADATINASMAGLSLSHATRASMLASTTSPPHKVDELR